MPLQQFVAEILFVRASYVKKIIEDCSNSEETVKLLRFCCWENPQFSSTVLSELLWQVCQLHLLKEYSGLKLKFNISFDTVCSILLHGSISLTVCFLIEFMISYHFLFSPQSYNSQNEVREYIIQLVEISTVIDQSRPLGETHHSDIPSDVPFAEEKHSSI